ncbi:hypothetical protein V8G54_002700 [Vigna mungo]|uniref:CG-1 domain-containing protein n=1 Tax=Vigna mungo TaxID=3915 RepID=A0AAQ3PAJ3_VIGMU
MTPGYEYDINYLHQEAQARWLKPAEVMYILQNHEKFQLTQEPPQQPTSGSLFLFNKRVLRFFRKDGHNWRKKRDGRTVGEAHERLKVGNVEALNCYYAHGEQTPSFQRRSYWMLDPLYKGWESCCKITCLFDRRSNQNGMIPVGKRSNVN